jgi:predicted nucleotidyltransferase
LEIIGIEQELTEKLGIKVDLVSKKSVNKYIESEILKDLIILS